MNKYSHYIRIPLSTGLDPDNIVPRLDAVQDQICVIQPGLQSKRADMNYGYVRLLLLDETTPGYLSGFFEELGRQIGRSPTESIHVAGVRGNNSTILIDMHSPDLWRLCGFILSFLHERNIRATQPNQNEMFCSVLFNRKWNTGSTEYLNWPELIKALNAEGHELDLGHYRFNVLELVRYSTKEVEATFDFREKEKIFAIKKRKKSKRKKTPTTNDTMNIDEQ
eukprot:TRINITY_DN4073_c0_g1_i1.p1 TRINITY_DN4073_c0_g1~~TRINITY_DN4073_c0_g1_i1.p1  ORF type:complete len:223 (-),score=39.76 TRINITY_DN4073_c0_g1_i1:27-695(-)